MIPDTLRKLRLSDDIQQPIIDLVTASICFVKIIASSLFLAGAGMMTGNDEWRIIGASALGGGFGAVVGVFLAIASTQVSLWQVLAMRWAVNFCFALGAGPFLALYVQEKFAPQIPYPGPIICLASGAAAGMFGVMMLQIGMPFFRKYCERKMDATTQRVWSDATTPPQNPPTKKL